MWRVLFLDIWCFKNKTKFHLHCYVWRAVVKFFLLFYSVGAPNTGESQYQINLLSFHYMHWEVAGFQIRSLKLIQIFLTKFTNGHILNAFFFNKNIKFCRSWSATLYIKSQKFFLYLTNCFVSACTKFKLEHETVSVSYRLLC